MLVAVVDAHGDTLNTYIDRAMGEEAPARPSAMYLAGADQRFRFLAFDLDAHGDAAAPLRDLDVLTGYLTDAGIPFLVCESGPAGGRHIWVGLAESIDADTVATLNRLVKHLCPSLDSPRFQTLAPAVCALQERPTVTEGHPCRSPALSTS